MKNHYDANKQVVREFLEIALNRRQPELAVERYLADGVQVHDPRIAEGDEPIIALVHGMTTAFPSLRYELSHLVAEGDLVVTHGRFVRGTDDPGIAAMSIFRLEDGRIVEHWGCFEEVATARVAASGPRRTMAV